MQNIDSWLRFTLLRNSVKGPMTAIPKNVLKWKLAIYLKVLSTLYIKDHLALCTVILSKHLVQNRLSKLATMNCPLIVKLQWQCISCLSLSLPSLGILTGSEATAKTHLAQLWLFQKLACSSTLEVLEDSHVWGCNGFLLKQSWTFESSFKKNWVV